MKTVTVTMPDIGEGVVEGEVIAWLKQPNDLLKQDEPVVVVMTDKATVELPAPYPGILIKQYYEVGQIAIKDKPLYDIAVEALAPKVQPEIPVAENEKKPESIQAEKPIERKGEKVLSTPPTRKLARELGIEIDQIVGTGMEGRVTNEDVVKHYKGSAAKSKALTPPLHLEGDTHVKLIGIRALTAKKMAESNEIVPHFSYFEQLDASNLVQLRNHFKQEAAKQEMAVTYLPFIIKALSLSLKKYPAANSCLDIESNTLIFHQQHNIGIAMTTKVGLIVPVLKNVERLTLQEIIYDYAELKSRALAGQLYPSDMKESTITISNFGVLGGGAMWATPIINYPEVAILGIGRIHKQPVVRNGAVVIRDVLNLSWSFDHRVIDGDLAAEISHHLSTLLQNPAPLL